MDRKTLGQTKFPTVDKLLVSEAADNGDNSKFFSIKAAFRPQT
jgi:hypothetical protein